MSDMNELDLVSLVLVIVGALNWGLYGLGQFAANDGNAYNLVYLIFNQAAGVPALESVTYLLVGLAGLYQVYFGYQLYEDQ